MLLSVSSEVRDPTSEDDPTLGSLAIAAVKNLEGALYPHSSGW